MKRSSGERDRSRGIRLRALATLLPLAFSLVALGDELTPRQIEVPAGGGEARGVFAERTLVVGIEIDRDVATLLAYTLKQRPYLRTLGIDPPRAHDAAVDVQLEVVLRDADGTRHTRRVVTGPLCLTHDGDAEPHVAGDTIRLHRDSILLELPELAGFDRLDLAYFEQSGGATIRRSLGTHRLDRARFERAAGPLTYADLAFATPGDSEPPASPRAATVVWPEDVSDPDIYQIYGDPADGSRRINVVIVPDGYTHADKATMQAHATAMVDHFRGKTPYAEHDRFINYTLVYAYSVQSGTDQCDCGIELNTAMGTRFLMQNPECGHSDNRCLYYGNGCDTNGTANIVAAELRAPYHDETIVMVNTTRYGGCGGSRGVYSAAVGSAVEIAVHELGHSLGGLADEYSYNAACGFNAGEINTSLDAVDGAWPEWIETLGPPTEGGQYYQQCIYRPQTNCEMRSLNQPFCAVCNQHWSLITFAHFRVAPVAPIETFSPDPLVTAWQGVPVDFSAVTRLSSGPGVSNLMTWTLNSPNAIGQIVATGQASHTHVFSLPGEHELSLKIIGDANFVKRAKDGPNLGNVSWLITVHPPPPEISAAHSGHPLRFSDADSLAWEDAEAAGALSYNLYRGDVLDLIGGGYGDCLESGIEQNSFDVDEDPPPSVAWFFLVAGENPAGEGPLGSTSSGAPRAPAIPCE